MIPVQLGIKVKTVGAFRIESIAETESGLWLDASFVGSPDRPFHVTHGPKLFPRSSDPTHRAYLHLCYDANGIEDMTTTNTERKALHTTHFLVVDKNSLGETSWAKPRLNALSRAQKKRLVSKSAGRRDTAAPPWNPSLAATTPQALASERARLAAGQLGTGSLPSNLEGTRLSADKDILPSASDLQARRAREAAAR